MQNITKLKAKDIVWNKRNREHIKKHDLTIQEVSEVFYDELRVSFMGKYSRPGLVGKSGKRMLILFLVETGKKYYLVTARDAAKKERQVYYEKNNIK